MATPFKGIILDVERPREYINFYSWEPIVNARNVNYDDVAVRGRSEPHPFYSNTDGRALQFTIHLVASFDQGDNGDPKLIKKQELFIESLEMPDYGDIPGRPTAVVKPPHRVRLQIKNLVNITGTLRGFTSTYIGPYDITTGYPYQIDVSFAIHEERRYGQQQPLGYADVRGALGPMYG